MAKRLHAAAYPDTRGEICQGCGESVSVIRINAGMSHVATLCEPCWRAAIPLIVDAIGRQQRAVIRESRTKVVR